MNNLSHEMAFTIGPGTNICVLPKDRLLVNNVFSFQTGVGGDTAVMSFRVKVINCAMETPDSNTLSLPTKRSIDFNGRSLEEVEVVNSSAFTFIMNATRRGA